MPNMNTPKQRYSSTFNSTPSSRASNRSALTSASSSHFHRRTASAVPVPPPSHKPPSTFHNFKGDLKTQDVFFDILKTFNSRVKVFFPGSHGFDVVRQQMWNHDAICTPCLILQPQSKAEVSDCIKAYTTGVLKCLTENRRNGRKLAVPRLSIAGGRCSNHAMKNGAIVIDMSSMRDVTVDDTNRTVTVEGGARVIDLDSATAEYGLTALSGTCQALGVVGCIFGGGFGYTSRKYGLACDNVLKAEIIMANGKLKRCSPDHHPDLLWSLCGGGGGFGVVVSVTLRCFPVSHAALLTYNLFTNNIDQRRSVIRRWANWIHGDVDNTVAEGDDVLLKMDGAPVEVYSQLILPTEFSRPIEFVGTSIDTQVIPQSDSIIEQFMDTIKKKRRFKILGGSSTSSHLTNVWEQVPGLGDLVHEEEGKLGAQSRSQESFRMLRYGDELQSSSNAYFKPGQLFLSYKYAAAMTAQIVEVLLEATVASNISPENESRIHIISGGGAMNEIRGDQVAFDARDMNYIIMIEGKWNADSRSREEKEKEKVIRWVQQTVNKLHKCDGIQSTVHPESRRDQVSKSGKSKPPNGFYNFSEDHGRRLLAIKERRDPKKVFSLTSRISFDEDSDFHSENATVRAGDMNQPESVPESVPPQKRKSLSTISVNIVRDNEEIEMTKPSKSHLQNSTHESTNESIQADESTSQPESVAESVPPQKRKSLSTISVNIVRDNEDIEMTNPSKSRLQNSTHQSTNESILADETMSKSVKELLTIVNNDDVLEDWAYPEMPLTKDDFRHNASIDL